MANYELEGISKKDVEP